MIVDEERWDAYRGIHKLRCLRLLGILTWDALGIPKLEIFCLLNSFYITVSLNHKNSSTQNLTVTDNLPNSVRPNHEIRSDQFSSKCER